MSLSYFVVGKMSINCEDVVKNTPGFIQSGVFFRNNYMFVRDSLLPVEKFGGIQINHSPDKALRA